MSTPPGKPRSLQEVAHLFLSSWKKTDSKDTSATKDPKPKREGNRAEKPLDVKQVSRTQLNFPIISFASASEELPHSFVITYRFLTYWRRKFSSLWMCSMDLPLDLRRSFNDSYLFPMKQELRQVHSIGRYSLGGNKSFIYVPVEVANNLSASKLERMNPANQTEAPFKDTLCLMVYPEESSSITRAITPLIDKIVLVVAPTVDSLREAYRRVKHSLSLNRSLELYLLIAGDVDLHLGEWLYSRFSRSVSRFLDRTVTFLGSCPISFLKGDNNNPELNGLTTFSMEALFSWKPEGNTSCEKLGFIQKLMDSDS